MQERPVDQLEKKEEVARPPMDPNEKDRILCPVTRQIFYDPVAVNGCNHLLERSITKRLMIMPNARCPCCRGPLAGGYSIVVDKRARAGCNKKLS